MTGNSVDAGVSDGTRIFLSWHRFAWLVRSLGGECHNSATVVGVPRRSTRIGAERESWQRLNLTAQGFEIETEMIYEAARNRVITTEAPIGCNWNSQLSRLSIFRDGLKTLRLLMAKLWADVRGR